MAILTWTGLLARVEGRLRANPAVLLLGPRQCGKTTLAREIASRRRAEYFDLEDPADSRRLAQPATTLGPLRGTVVIDEAQLRPELFPLLRVLTDRRPLPARFLLLGSASPDLVQKLGASWEGFALEEVPPGDGVPRGLLLEHPGRGGAGACLVRGQRFGFGAAQVRRRANECAGTRSLRAAREDLKLWYLRAFVVPIPARSRTRWRSGRRRWPSLTCGTGC